jgi:hypothetical protein
MAVDVETFCRSAYHGMIRHLFLTGVLMAIPIEVAEPRASDLQDAFSRLQENGGHMTGMIGEPQTVMLESGVQVGVMNIPDASTKLPDLPSEPAAVTQSHQLEPGVTVPGVTLEPAQVAPAQEEQTSKKKKKGKKDPAGASAQDATPTYENWKENLDFQTQKTKIAESTDKNFLAWVSSNDESRQLQKIASARLAELEKAV